MLVHGSWQTDTPWQANTRRLPVPGCCRQVCPGRSAFLGLFLAFSDLLVSPAGVCLLLDTCALCCDCVGAWGGWASEKMAAEQVSHF